MNVSQLAADRAIAACGGDAAMPVPVFRRVNQFFRESAKIMAVLRRGPAR
jgi:hypothetical protein